MIQVLDYVTLECSNDTSAKVYHVQLVATAGGFQCLAHYGRIGRTPKLTEKTPPGVGYPQARAAFESVTAEKRVEYLDVSATIPEESEPYRDADWRIATAREAEAIIAAANERSRRLDDPEHAARVAAARAENTDRFAEQRTEKALRQGEISQLRELERQERIRDLAQQILALGQFYPYVPELTTIVAVTKAGAAITVDPPELRDRLVRLAREIGGTFELTAMLIADRFCLMKATSGLPVVRGEVLLSPDLVFTQERRAAIIRYVVEHDEYPVLSFYDPKHRRRTDISRADLLDALPLLAPLLEGFAA